ncbi:hypothetical protein GCK32_014959 [Trichostrongylus colubriformis]|uniref:Uncharacterized protein n=1 Tax=Trichostrongylus colubriformis TaxID=6319 RepID=A0AAN8FIZ7_TRICO
MPGCGSSPQPEQLYTKRRFLQVNNEEKLVRLVRRDEHVRGSRHPQRLIRLIPVEKHLVHMQNDNGSQYNVELMKRITAALERVASASDKYRYLVENLVKDGLISTAQEAKIEGSSTTEKMKTSDVLQRLKPTSSDGTPDALNDSLALLLEGQQRIGLRIDSLKRDQEINKLHIEEVLKKVIDEVKSELAGKTKEHTDNLEKMKAKQDFLYQDFNTLNTRLDEMEMLVSKLMRESEPPEVVLRVHEMKKPATIEEISDEEDSLQSVLSVSSGSPAEGPEGVVKKTRKPSQAFVFVQRTTPKPFEKKDVKEDVETTHL